jgi:endonuclease/exonuclease/phosphatase family metal-dependent hydrolase
VPFSSKLTIYSRNIFGIPFKKPGRRFKGISQQISDINPDIVMLQEFTSGLFLLYFQQQLKDYNFFYYNNGPFTYGGLLTMVKKNLQTDNYHFTQFTDQGPKYNLHLFDNLITRGFQSLFLPDFNLQLINTHILAKYFSRKSFVPIQLGQIEQIRRFLRQQTSPCFLTGDFNFYPNSPPYKLLLQDTSLTDVSNHLGNSCLVRKKYLHRLDYVFLDPSRIKVDSIGYVADPKFLSDHRAILTKMSTKNKL